MHVKPQDIRFCLDKATEIAENYRLYVLDGTNARRSVDDLLWMCEEYLKLKIFRALLDDLPAEGSSIRGLYLNFDEGCEIYLLSGMNYCWTRFVLCKELFHLLIDSVPSRNPLIYEHLKEIIATFPEPHSNPGAAAVSELMAEIAAMEFMFPYQERVAARAGKTVVNYLEIAEFYKIPQFYVEKYLSEGWMQYLGAFHPAHHQNPNP